MNLLCFFFMFCLCFKLSAETLKVSIQDLPSNKGKLLYLLFKDEKGFPDDEKESVVSGSQDLKLGVEFEIKDLKPGTYALSVIHDANDNEKLDTNFIGIPKEAFGFSNDPKIYFGPPSFKKASFEVKHDSEIKIKMKKM